MPGTRWRKALFALPPDALERELVRLDCILDEQLHELRDEAERRLHEQRRPKLRLVVGGQGDGASGQRTAPAG